jgi:hypothetical protein
LIAAQKNITMTPWYVNAKQYEIMQNFSIVKNGFLSSADSYSLFYDKLTCTCLS